MKSSVAHILDKPLHRYIIVGGSIYLLELLVIYIAQSAGFSPVTSVGISFWVGLSVSFILQKVLTFEDRRFKNKILLSQILAFTALVLFNFSFTVFFTKLVSPTISAFAARTIALGLTTIWNYYLYKTKIFNSSKDYQGIIQ